MAVPSPSPERQWRMRPYQEGDEVEIVALFQQVFKRSLPKEEWLWKFRGRPSHVKNVWLAVVGDQPIFHYGGIPVRYVIDGVSWPGMVSVDAMASSGYRRQGLLTTGARTAYEAWRDGGIPFTIGMPNEKWGSRAKALGWLPLFPLQWVARPLRPEQITARLLHISKRRLPSPMGAMLNGFYGQRTRSKTDIKITTVDAASPALPIFDRLWSLCGPSYAVSIVRDASWVVWRYLQHPTKAYVVLLAGRDETPAGYLAYQLVEEDGYRWGLIPELFTAKGDRETQIALIRTAVERLREAGAEIVYTLVVPHTDLDGAYRRAGFFIRRWQFQVQYVPFSEDSTLERLLDPDGWHMAGGDYDVI